MALVPRRATAADAEPLAALLSRIAADHHIELELTAREVVDRLERSPGMVLDGAWDGDDLVAFTGVVPRAASAGTHPIHLVGDVDPARLGEGIATLMLGRALTAAREIHRRDHPDDRLRIVTSASAGRDDQADLLLTHGFSCDRHSFLMVAPLVDVPPAHLPDDLLLSVFAPTDAEELRLAHNAAFTGYPNYVDLDEAAWDAFVMSPSYARHEHSFVLRDPQAGGAIVSYVVTQEDEIAVSGAPGREAHVAFVGTVPSHRGRGLAGALLAHALGAYRTAGFETSALDVDTANPTGALGIYERAGYVVHQRRDNYSLEE